MIQRIVVPMVSVRCYRHRFQTRRQRIARWAAAVAYIYLALGIPLPIPVGAAPGETYPCMNHRCGCLSAEQCWHNCCCLSLFDKLVWARENHVTPPDYVLAEAELRGIQWHAFCLHACDETNSTCACCAHHAAAGPETSCGKSGCTKSSEIAVCARQSRPARGIVLIEALKCSGAGETWHGMSVSLSPPPEVSFSFADDHIERTCSSSPRLLTISFPPDLPPPRSTVG